MPLALGISKKRAVVCSISKIPLTTIFPPSENIHWCILKLPRVKLNTNVFYIGEFM